MTEESSERSQYIRAHCESCGKEYRLLSKNTGKKAKCSCGSIFLINPEPGSYLDINSQSPIRPSTVSSPIADSGAYSKEKPKEEIIYRSSSLQKSADRKTCPTCGNALVISRGVLYTFVFCAIVNTILSYLNYIYVQEHLVLFVPIQTILFYVLIYKIWAVLKLSHVKTDPGFAVFGFFIPFYNIYWCFQAFFGWAIHCNKALHNLNVTKPQISIGLSLATGLSTYILIGSLIFGFVYKIPVLISAGASYTNLTEILFFLKAARCADAIRQTYTEQNISQANPNSNKR
jgi:ribosomal protein S27E